MLRPATPADRPDLVALALAEDAAWSGGQIAVARSARGHGLGRGLLLHSLAELRATVRRAEAQALYAEGLTMEQIADRFGVTRQRVSTLLRKTRGRAGPGARGHAAPG